VLRIHSDISPASRHRLGVRVLAASLGIAAALLGTRLTSQSAGDLQSQIAAGRSAAASLQAQVAADTAQIRQTTGSVRAAERQLAELQAQLNGREAQLRQVQDAFLAARNHLVDLENRLRLAASDLAANLVANYENQQPDLVTVILEANGFNDLLERISFLQRIGRQDAEVVKATRAARIAVRRQVTVLGALEQRDRTLTLQVLAQRNQVAALQLALLRRQLSEIQARRGVASKLSAVNSRVHSLEAKAAAQAARAAATGSANVGGISVDTGGMVQPPPGAPAAVAEVIAAGNAIATLPYIYGGGHASFHADGYDCSGSVSYALAAAGLVTSPMVSGQFENWGDPGPGRWITVYANAGHVWMEVAGWRFDTVALAEGGTRWAQGGGEFAGFVVRHPPGL
jgi:cell wall-associated NlpC family hydrolase